MSGHHAPSLIKLSESDQMPADPAGDLRGREVFESDGSDLGRIADLLIDAEEHQVRFLLVEHGGVLGIGGTSSFIPVDAISDIDDDAVHVTEPRERVAAAPVYDPALVDASEYYDSVYDYYGFAPFWTAGYIYTGHRSGQ